MQVLSCRARTAHAHFRNYCCWSFMYTASSQNQCQRKDLDKQSSASHTKHPGTTRSVKIVLLFAKARSNNVKTVLYSRSSIWKQILRKKAFTICCRLTYYQESKSNVWEIKWSPLIAKWAGNLFLFPSLPALILRPPQHFQATTPNMQRWRPGYPRNHRKLCSRPRRVEFRLRLRRGYFRPQV